MSTEAPQETTVADIAAEATQEATPAKSLYDVAVAETGAAAPAGAQEFKKTFLVLYSVPTQTFDVLTTAEFLRHHHECFMESRMSQVVIESVHSTYEGALMRMKALQIPR